MNINWDEMPEWAIGCGYIGKGHYVWFSHNNYAPITTPNAIYRYESGGALYSEIQGKVYPSKTKPEWRDPGDGFPLIGSEHELKPYWHKVLIVAHDVREEGTRIVYWDHHDSIYSYTYRHDFFRPIKSDREKWVEEARAIFDRVDDRFPPTRNTALNALFNEIYDALQSGELPTPKGR